MKKHSKRLLTAAALVMTTTATIHIINKVIAASACLKEMLDTDVRNYYHWRFGDIYYTKKGKGSPIDLQPFLCRERARIQTIYEGSA